LLAKLKKPAPKAAVKIPRLADASPEIAGLEKKRVEFDQRKNSLDRERSKLWLAANDGADEGDDAVAELLGDDRDPNRPSRQSARERLSDIAREIATVSKAIDVVDERIRSARHDASKKIRESVRPEYATRVKAIAAAIASLVDAQSEYSRFVSDLNAADVAWTPLVPLGAHQMIGDPRDMHGPAARWFKEAQDAGYLTDRDIPECLK
jgi:hypothetical protein